MARDAEEIKALPGRLLADLRRVLDQCEPRPKTPPVREPRLAPPAVQRVKPAPPSAARTIDDLPEQIETAPEAETLSAHLFSPRRDVPVVVVSRSTGLAYAYADTDRLRRDPPRIRNAGRDTCWRVNLQTNTPSARRLHYWLCADGSIELSSIRLHDDFEP